MISKINFPYMMNIMRNQFPLESVKFLEKYHKEHRYEGHHLEYDNETNDDFIICTSESDRFFYRVIMTYINMCNSVPLLLVATETLGDLYRVYEKVYGRSIALAFRECAFFVAIGNESGHTAYQGIDNSSLPVKCRDLIDYRLPVFERFIASLAEFRG